MRIGIRPPSPSRRDNPHPRRPDNNREGDWRRRTRGASYERRRKRSRSKSRGRESVQQLPDTGVDEHRSQRAQSESQTLTGSSGLSPPAPNAQVVKGKGKAVDLGGFTNGLSPSTSRSEAERETIDKRVGNVQTHGLPNTEHTVIDDSKRGNRDRAPKALTLRQSIQAHLSLPQTEPLQVSRPPIISGPDLRHGRPSLVGRISGMEEVSHDQLVSVSTTNLGVPACPESTVPPRSAAVQPEQPEAASNNIDTTNEDIIDIGDNHSDPDPISSHVRQDNGKPTAQAERPDRVPRLNTQDVLERTRIRLAKTRNVMVAGIPPTAPTPPPIPLDLSTPAESDKITPTPVVTTLRNKLLERLESERKRAIGAASGEPEVEPVVENISEGSLKAELRARNQLRARLAVARTDRHVDNLEP